MCFYDKDFDKNLIYPQGLTYNPCPEGCGGVSSSKIYFLSENQQRWTKYYLKIFIGCVWGNGEHAVLVAFQSLSTIKKGTSHSNFQLNEPFLRQLLLYEVPCSKGKN